MKLKTAGLLTLVSILGGAANANAAALFDIYAGATAGLGRETTFADNDHISQSAQSYGAILGIDIPFLRVEGEYNYLSTTDSRMHIGMVNGYFKIPLIIVTPYFGAGIGSIFNGEAIGNIDVQNAAAYQGMIGATFDIPVLPFKADIEARALYAPNIYDAASSHPDFLHYDMRVKLRYIF